MGKYWFEVFEPPNALKPKVSSGCGMTQQEMLAKAKMVVESLHDDFAEELEATIEKLRESERLLGASHEESRSQIDIIFRLSHEMKGQGRTFGFDLVSSIGESLCALLDRADPGHPKLAQATKTHIDALHLVSSRGMRGDGGETGAKLMESLWKEVEVVGGPPKPPPALPGGNRDALKSPR